MTSNFIISPYAISFESIKNSLQKYVLQRSQSDQAWKDFYISGTGETIIELAAALGTFYSFQFISGRRENFMTYAQNYTSLIGLAQNLGYNVKRGRNIRLRLTIIPNRTIINLTKWSVIGSYAEFDIVLLDDVTLNEGISSTIDVVIGNSMVEDYLITSPDISVFTYTSSNVTDDCRLILNNTQVPYSNNIEDAILDKYIMLSNVYGAVDVFYLNEGNYKYTGGNHLYLNFIERNNLKYDSISTDQLNIDYTDRDIVSMELIEDIVGREEKEKIRVVAPLYHQNSSLIRSRRDYRDYLLINDTELVDANDKDIYPGLIEVTYLKYDKTFMTEAEKEQWLDKMDYIRPGGVANALITDPSQVTVQMDISLWKQTGTGTLNSSIDEEVSNIITPYENKLGVILDVSEIEHNLEELEGVKIARIDIPDQEWEASTAYDQYTFTDTDYGKYYIESMVYKTGAEEPDWSSLTSVGDILIDNEIVWERVSKYPENEVNTWLANTVFSLNDCIREQIGEDTFAAFRVVSFVGKTGAEEPDWALEEVKDNDVIWQLTEDTSSTGWSSEADAQTDDIIRVSINGSYKYFKALNDGTTGTEEPNWVKEQVNDHSITWKLSEVENNNSWSASTSKKIGDTIKVVSGSINNYYIVVNLRGSSGSETPDWSTQDTIYDGNLKWEFCENSQMILPLEWNQYLNIDYNFRII